MSQTKNGAVCGRIETKASARDQPPSRLPGNPRPAGTVQRDIMRAPISITVNGETRQVDADGSTSLLEALRDDLALTGTKYGCGEAQCGSCTVILDGQPIRSCITALSEVGNKQVRTIESLAKNGRLHPVQQAFIEEGAMQCGYCVPGMIMSAVALLERNQNPTESQIRAALQGNICRCCAYPRMIAAAKRAAEIMRNER